MCGAAWKSGAPQISDQKPIAKSDFKISADRSGKRVKGKES